MVFEKTLTTSYYTVYWDAPHGHKCKQHFIYIPGDATILRKGNRFIFGLSHSVASVIVIFVIKI